MSQYRKYSTEFHVTDDSILLVTTIGGNVLTAEVARDGSLDTNLAAAIVTHKDVALDAPPTATAPSCSVTTTGRWNKAFLGEDFTTFIATLRVPVGNSGVLVFKLNGTTATTNFILNGGSPTSFVDNDTLTVTDGDTLALQVEDLPESDEVSGYVEDQDTGEKVDDFSLFNTTPAP